MGANIFFNLGHILAYTVAYIEERSCAIEEYILTCTIPIKTQVLGHPQTENWCEGSEGVIGQGGIWKVRKMIQYQQDTMIINKEIRGYI